MRYQQQQQQQYYDYYNSPTAPQPQYAQQQQYYYPNQPNAPEAYGSQSPYNNPYINGKKPVEISFYTAVLPFFILEETFGPSYISLLIN